MKTLQKTAFFVTLFVAFCVHSNQKGYYERIWLSSPVKKVVLISSQDKRTYENILIKGFKLRHPNKRLCSSQSLKGFERDLELEVFIKSLTKRGSIEKNDIKTFRGYPFCKKYHFKFAVLSQVLNRGYSVLAVEKVPLRKKSGTI